MSDLDTDPKLMFRVKLRKKTHDPDGLLWYCCVESTTDDFSYACQAYTFQECLRMGEVWIAKQLK